MRARSIFPLILLAAVAWCVPETVKFVRTYKEGDTDQFKMNLAMAVNGGDVTMKSTMTQKVLKVYRNGEVDLETAITDMHVDLMGQEMTPAPQKPVQTHLDKNGMPVTPSTNSQQRMGFDYGKLAGLLMNRNFTVGQTVPVAWTDAKNNKNKIKGTVVVESLTNGVAKVVSKLDLWNDLTTDKPIKVALTAQIEAASAKTNRAEGQLTDLPVGFDGIGPSLVSFQLERVLPAKSVGG